jgi:ABC-type siderophore export system fused ATPase/permease subunit
MESKGPESPHRKRTRVWLWLSLRTLLILAVVGLVIGFAWDCFTRTRLFHVIRGVQELEPQAQKRNQELRELTGRPAENPDK